MHEQPFDEAAALAELERLRETIQAARQARQQKSDEFERFVQARRRSGAGATDPADTPATAAVSDTPSRAADAVAPISTVHPERRIPIHRRRLGIVTIAGLAIVAATGAGVFMSRSRKPAAAAVPAATSVTSSPVSRPSEPSPPPAVLAAPSGVRVELVVVRPVWMRVTVDGEKKREGVVAAGEQLRFNGDRAIVIRVGDGGAVVVHDGGRQEPLGSTGQPITRTFTVVAR